MKQGTVPPELEKIHQACLELERRIAIATVKQEEIKRQKAECEQQIRNEGSTPETIEQDIATLQTQFEQQVSTAVQEIQRVDAQLKLIEQQLGI